MPNIAAAETGVQLVWTPPVVRDRTDDGRLVYVVSGKRYVEVPLSAEDAYRFLAELRIEMAAPEFRAFVERHRTRINPTVLWRLGLGAIPIAPQERDRVELARAELSRLMRAA